MCNVLHETIVWVNKWTVTALCLQNSRHLYIGIEAIVNLLLLTIGEEWHNFVDLESLNRNYQNQAEKWPTLTRTLSRDVTTYVQHILCSSLSYLCCASLVLVVSKLSHYAFVMLLYSSNCLHWFRKESQTHEHSAACMLWDHLWHNWQYCESANCSLNDCMESSCWKDRSSTKVIWSSLKSKLNFFSKKNEKYCWLARLDLNDGPFSRLAILPVMPEMIP